MSREQMQQQPSQLGTVMAFLGFLVLLAGGVGTLAAWNFHRICEEERSECDYGTAGDQCICSPATALYFAAQTITTVGYGSGLNLKTSRMRVAAAGWCMAGALIFGAFVAAFFWFLQQGYESLKPADRE